MKRLYLLRHAQSPAAYGIADFERCLSDEGKAQASALGHVMQAKSYHPDIIYCSPALRTMQTLAGLMETLEERPTQTPRSIYESSRSEILNLIQATAPDINSILIVAHNPSVHQLAAMLADEQSPGYEALLTGYAPATLSVLECDLEDWKDIQPSANALVNLIRP